ncbi:immunoglobulin I-set domain protein [Oesophagostomum dentatum]|uniref:Immunoglobulin I-set domain protein n=1 Tax=Oesophagostomum dentatum TaxID=61180 RepID=A0A0B1TLJ8_OESDE|nr:immunoglobulin I-set domain protein [Oesophagostomum dentatum]
MQSEEMKVVAGRGATIRCEVFGNPPPKVEWLKNGQQFQSELLQSSTNLAYLHLREASVEDAGRYTCIAANRAGEQRASTQLHVIDGDRARLECKVEGHPAPTVRWLRGGRPIEDMSNFILSPRGETLMILKARRADAGSYSCVAKNAAGETEAGFTVSVFTAPHIEESVDQNPHIVQGKTLTFYCPVLGNPDPKVEWRRDNLPLEEDPRFSILEGKHLQIEHAQKEDEGRYTCHAYNEAGVLDTDYESEVIDVDVPYSRINPLTYSAPPKFHRTGESVYEVVEHEAVTLDCAVVTEPKPEVIWYRGEQPLYLAGNMALSPDAMVSKKCKVGAGSSVSRNRFC